MHTLETPLLLLEIKMLYFDHSDFTLLTSFIYGREYISLAFLCACLMSCKLLLPLTKDFFGVGYCMEQTNKQKNSHFLFCIITRSIDTDFITDLSWLSQNVHILSSMWYVCIGKLFISRFEVMTVLV